MVIVFRFMKVWIVQVKSSFVYVRIKECVAPGIMYRPVFVTGLKEVIYIAVRAYNMSTLGIIRTDYFFVCEL